jgi:PAS domain S-box-containing protein
MVLRHLILVLGVVASLIIAGGTTLVLWAARTDALGSPADNEWVVGGLGALAAGFVLALALAIYLRLRSDARLRADVREGAAQLDAIVQSAMDAIITVDADQRIVVFNAAAEKVFGCHAADALGSVLDRFVPARFRAVHREHLERFARTGETGRRVGLQTALWGLRTDGTEFPIEASISQASVGSRKLLTVILCDIGERVKAEAESLRAQQHIRESRERLHAIVRSAMDAIITVDTDQRIVLFNAAAEQMFDCEAAQAIGGSLERFIPERFHAAHRRHVERFGRFGRTGDTGRRMGPQAALTARRADGTEFPIEASISHATVGAQHLFTVILRDISARLSADAEIHRAHDQLRDISVAMLEVREVERTRIARELHDELGQALTGLKMDLELLAALLPADRQDLRETAGAMRTLLDGTVATTRRISADLRPLVLDDLGLGAAAEWLAQHVLQRAGITCTLEVDPECAQLGEPHASALFRIMQESLTNVVRHARARRVTVRLADVDGVAELSVRDDGVGMEGGAREKPRSFGLRGISERVLLLGGSVDITSVPGAGTGLVARIPLGGRRGKEAA